MSNGWPLIRAGEFEPKSLVAIYFPVYARPMRNFVVAARERGRTRRRELHRVEADTAEHAVLMVAATRPAGQQGAIYDAWRPGAPEHMLRMTLAEPGEQ